MRRILVCCLVCMGLASCAQWRPAADTTPDRIHNEADGAGPQRPMYLPGDSVMKKSDTPGKVGDDAYTCADKACTTAIKVK